MCSWPEISKSTSPPQSHTNNQSNTVAMHHVTVETEDSFSSLHELAANNDLYGFNRSIESDSSAIDEVEFWYGRQKGSRQMILEHKTPLMVAATYGSVDVLKLILINSKADVNFSCGPDRITALHCAASGGSINAVKVVELLLSAGANPKCVDANGHTPVDVISVHPKLVGLRASLEQLLTNYNFHGFSGEHNFQVSIINSNQRSNLPTKLPSSSPSSHIDLGSSPMAAKFNDFPANAISEKKEYHIDPSLPDIKNGIYSTDEFRMYSFKVRPCSRAYSHDWTECPFVHPGENARRRDPRKFHYSCVPCPEFRKGSCRRGDLCEYAHGVFECWLHPAQYRTRLCKDGTGCMRRVCFFAHITEELRPLYVSTGSSVPSPRSSLLATSVMDMAAAMNLLPGSPSSVPGMPQSPFPQSPSASIASHFSLAWPHPNVPTLNLPVSNIQSSRLRSSLNARDMPPEDLRIFQDFETQQRQNDIACFSPINRPVHLKTLSPSNPEDLFSAEITLSPRYSDQAAFCRSPKSVVLSQFQQKQNMLSPINTGMFSPKNVEHPLLQASFGVPSPGRMSPRNVEPISSRMISPFAQQEFPYQHFRSHCSRELGSSSTNSIVGSPVSAWCKWGSPYGKVDWSVNGDELGRMRRSISMEPRNGGNEPNLSWVKTLVMESPSEVKDKPSVAVSGSEVLNSKQTNESVDHSVLGAWLEQMHLDELVV